MYYDSRSQWNDNTTADRSRFLTNYVAGMVSLIRD